MGELTIRRNRVFTVPQYQSAGKAEKASASGASQKASAAKPGFTISETLRQLMSRVSQGEGQLRESRRTLGTGESVLAEVQDRLGRMEQLAREAGGSSDRAALQAELELLRQDVDRMISSASAGGTPLFLDGAVDAEEGAEALLSAILDQSSAQGEGLALPEWLISGLVQEAPDPERLLAALGLDKTASPSDILAAVIGRSPESDPAAGYLAALYLGAVIAGGGKADPQGALDGLRQLLDTAAQGVPLDQAIEELTGGTFTSLDDFLAQFSNGTAPDLQAVLGDFLLTGGGTDLLPDLTGSSLLAMLAGMEGMNLDLLMGLLTVLPSPEAPPGAGPENSLQGADSAAADPASGPVSVLQAGDLQVLGQDLSQVSESNGVLTVGGAANVLIQGTGQGEGIHTLVITGSATVTLQNVELSLLTADTPQASLFTVGENEAGLVQLGDGTVLTLGGTGLLRAAALSAGQSSALRQTGGALVLGTPGETSEPLTLPLVLDGPVSLAAQAAQVNSSSGRALAPFDVLWETLLPGWSSITAMAADGAEAKMALFNGQDPDPIRLWLSKGEQGFPVHTLFFRGRDSSGQLMTQYAYLRWSQSAGTFQEVPMYPNPFTITGGEAGRDWFYEEESHTLHILSSQVTALSGGAGTDGNQTPFSGRIALADGIGAAELALGGVECRVVSGRAFDLGRDNQVTLILRDSTDNRFESGAGCAGISLGEGTSLRIDRESGDSAGALTALGTDGGAGIGRDSGAGRNRNSHILIRGGVITASGSGGGAGIGAGRHGAMGSVTILGGWITSTGGKGGGAGIGAALGAPVGDISIRGGRVTAEAVYHAAAIGAGIQGACGDIHITGTARIVKALGGDPGADIGACLFGGCGEVRVSGGADIGAAKLRRQSGVPLQTGEDTVTLPQFRLSASALGLDRLSLSSREEAKAAQATLEADRRLIDQIQTAYGALHTRLEHGLQGHYRYGGTFQGPLRDIIAASKLLQDMRQSDPFQSGQALLTHSKRGTEDVSQLLR